MEMHQLRYAVAIARTGNFSRAAEKCHVAQPSLSQQIQKLEDELGERLFHRTRREAKLTYFGEAFITRAQRILEEAEAARREAAETRDLQRGVVTLGALPTIAPYLLPSVLSAFTRKNPGVRIEVLEDTTSQLLVKVLSYEADFALASLPIKEAELEIKPILTEELYVALPRNHPLAGRRHLRPSDLQGEKFIVMKEGHCLGEQVAEFCDSRGVRPQISFQSAQLETVQALVRHGLGISLIPAMALKKSDAPEYRRFAKPPPEREIVAVYPRNRIMSRAAAELLSMFLRRAPAQ